VIHLDVDNYNRVFNKYPPLCTTDRWVYGMWMIGNNYRNPNKYYGEYPPTYLNRIYALFPSAQNILHLFSGSVRSSKNPLLHKETTFDINPTLKPDVIGDAEKLSDYFCENFDLVLADPPYSKEDAFHYGIPMINRNKVIIECQKMLTTPGFLVWLDQVFPMFSKKEGLSLIGTIGVIRSTNHRVRTVFIFKKT